MSWTKTRTQADQVWQDITNSPQLRKAGGGEALLLHIWLKADAFTANDHVYGGRQEVGGGPTTYSLLGRLNDTTIDHLWNQMNMQGGNLSRGNVDVGNGNWQQYCHLFLGKHDLSVAQDGTEDTIGVQNYIDGVEDSDGIITSDKSSTSDETAVIDEFALGNKPYWNGSSGSGWAGHLAHLAKFKIVSTAATEQDKWDDLKTAADTLASRLDNGGFAIAPDAVDITNGYPANITVTLYFYCDLIADFNVDVGSATVAGGSNAGGGSFDSADNPPVYLHQVVGTVSETETALALNQAVTFQVGLVAETEAPLALNQAVTFQVGKATETEAPLGVAVVHEAGLASETESALQLKVAAAVGVVSETETPLPVNAIYDVGAASETEAPLALAVVFEVGAANENEAPLAIDPIQELGLVSETERPIALVSADALGTVTETEAPLAIDPIQELGLVSETEAPLGVAVVFSVGTVVETEAPLSVDVIYEVGLVAENENAIAIAQGVEVGLVSETEAALAIVSQQEVGLVSENELALGINQGIPLEPNTARIVQSDNRSRTVLAGNSVRTLAA